MKILCAFGEHAYGDPARGESYEAVNFIPAFQRLGHEVALFDSFSRRHDVDFAALNQRFLKEVDEFRPDVIFTVLMSYEIWTETLDLIRAGSPALIVNWGTDDSWKFSQVSRFLASHVDFHVTTDPAGTRQAEQAGLDNVVRSQWAASQTQLLPPLPSGQCVQGVAFIGNLYGERRAWIEALQARGIAVATFGNGSAYGVVAAADIPKIHNKYMISLNFSNSGRQLSAAGVGRSTQIKARVFEVPGHGGALLTQNAPGLSDYFEMGKEIDVFDDVDGLKNKIEFYLSNPAARDRLAQAGFAKASARHTYDVRFRELLEHVLRAAKPERLRQPWTLDARQLDSLVARHRRVSAIQPIRTLVETLARTVVGRDRAARAARRIVFEGAWRLMGARTFSAAGIPGRLFFAES